MRYSKGDLVWIKQEKKLVNEINENKIDGNYFGDHFIVKGYPFKSCYCNTMMCIEQINVNMKHQCFITLVDRDDSGIKIEVPVEVLEDHTPYNTITLLCYALDVKRYDVFGLNNVPDKYEKTLFRFTEDSVEMIFDDENEWRQCDLGINYFLYGGDVVKEEFPEDHTMFYVPSVSGDPDTFIYERKKNHDKYEELKAMDCLFENKDDAIKRASEIRELLL